jgi:TM2 domain-containing membrane protein YozV
MAGQVFMLIECPNCFALMRSPAKYCRRCGHPLPAPATSRSATPDPDDIRKAAMALFLANGKQKSLATAYGLCLWLGSLGAHRFYLGRKRSAAAMLIITLASIPLLSIGIGYMILLVSSVWSIVDLFLIPGIYRERNKGLLDSIVGWNVPTTARVAAP